MSTLEQWQAGKSIEGLPPWDGTGIPLPVDETGWPVDPDPAEPLFDGPPTVEPAGPVVEGIPVTVSIATLRDPDGPVELWSLVWPSPAWELVGEMTEVDATHFTATFDTTYVGRDVVFQARSGGLASPDSAPLAVDNMVVTITIDPEAPPRSPAFNIAIEVNAALGLPTLTQFDNVSVHTPLVVTEVDPLHFTSQSDPAAYPGDGTAPVSITLSATVSGSTISKPVTVAAAVAADPNMGWTKAELIQFAADHDPAIDVPTSGTKAEILAAILAYIQAHPEEN